MNETSLPGKIFFRNLWSSRIALRFTVSEWIQSRVWLSSSPVSCGLGKGEGSVRHYPDVRCRSHPNTRTWVLGCLVSNRNEVLFWKPLDGKLWFSRNNSAVKIKVLVTVWWQIRRPKLLVWLLRASCRYFIQSSKPSNSWIWCAFGMVFRFLGTTLLWRAFLEQRSQKELLSFLLSSSGFTAHVSKSHQNKLKGSSTKKFSIA